MDSEDRNKQDAGPESTDSDGQQSEGGSGADAQGPGHSGAGESSDSGSDTSFYDDPYHDESDHLYDDPHADPPDSAAGDEDGQEPPATGDSGTPPPPPPSDEGDEDEDDEEEDGMARMSFLEHLEELRTRILRALGGLLVVYLFCLAFANDLLRLAIEPFRGAARAIAGPGGEMIQMINTRPLEQFQVQYIKVPLLAAVFLGAPWLTYQAWQFIAPGLYRKEKRWAVPFIFTTAVLFVLGGVFCYFVALRVTLQFLLTVTEEVEPYISVSDYLNTFIILEIGLGLVFQLPVLIFFFTLLRLTTPRFLLRNVRYAVLVMFIVAAIITPTGDPITMTLFAGPMILLYFVGIGASWLLVLRREGRRLPWLRIGLSVLAFFALIAAIIAYMHFAHDYGLTPDFPWFGPTGPPEQ
ncbi:MAG: twin-arginine translocase subunit TatC [Bryobacterales bacterium]|nr:twin-arginine translocase subunit TatC [Bryobacterales bacterium]MDE0261216.1 twin-arginine translocase subunit TatC [Bryobacterales bacterium]MDE0623205.1 twin-arginine translocase subunit TatC [Bryobacterales bacterium]